MIEWVGVIILAALFLLGFELYLRARGLANRVMENASRDFFESSNSMMDTPDDVPDMVLDILSQMGNMAQDKSVSFDLARVGTKLRAGGAASSEEVLVFRAEVESMRPELKELFKKAVTAWLGYVTHQNVFNMLRIYYAELRYRSQGMRREQAEEAVGLQFLGMAGGRLC
ncbi:hypothetical protein [Yoonia sp. BS5-3]|uniref:Uncharacterized protein n=1 Tax=Yoonia phaeophyticola TaxID=3137369 RepID=A0ABZ2V484_9RHOB